MTHKLFVTKAKSTIGFFHFLAPKLKGAAEHPTLVAADVVENEISSTVYIELFI